MVVGGEEVLEKTTALRLDDGGLDLSFVSLPCFLFFGHLPMPVPRGRRRFNFGGGMRDRRQGQSNLAG